MLQVTLINKNLAQVMSSKKWSRYKKSSFVKLSPRVVIESSVSKKLILKDVLFSLAHLWNLVSFDLFQSSCKKLLSTMNGSLQETQKWMQIVCKKRKDRDKQGTVKFLVWPDRRNRANDDWWSNMWQVQGEESLVDNWSHQLLLLK